MPLTDDNQRHDSDDLDHRKPELHFPEHFHGGKVQAQRKYYGGAVSAPVFGAIMGGVLRTMNIEPDALTTGDKNEFVINQGEGTGGRS